MPIRPWPQVGAEGEGVADHRPLHADDAHGHEGVHHGGEDVFLADHAAVEEGQAGDHEEDQRRGDEHPGGVAGVEDRVDVLRLVAGAAAAAAAGCSRAGAAGGCGRSAARSGWRPVRRERCRFFGMRSQRGRQKTGNEYELWQGRLPTVLRRRQVCCAQAAASLASISILLRIMVILQFLIFKTTRVCRLDCFFAFLAGPDPHGFFQRHDEDLAVADPACLCRLLDGLDHLRPPARPLTAISSLTLGMKSTTYSAPR